MLWANFSTEIANEVEGTRKRRRNSAREVSATMKL